jgi:RNase P subunit RPR2
MTNKELQAKLESLKTKLSEANRENDKELINQYVDELNKLWDKASVEMVKNAKEGGWHIPDKS